MSVKSDISSLLIQVISKYHQFITNAGNIKFITNTGSVCRSCREEHTLFCIIGIVRRSSHLYLSSVQEGERVVCTYFMVDVEKVPITQRESNCISTWLG